MELQSMAAKQGFSWLKSVIRNTYGRYQRRRLIAQAIKELLMLAPDLDSAEAKIRAAKALGLPPTALDVRARKMFDNVRAHKKSGRFGAKKSALKKEKRPVPRKPSRHSKPVKKSPRRGPRKAR